MPCTTTNGGHVALARRHRRDERALADADELRDAAQAPEGHPVLDDGVARELRAVGEDAAASPTVTSCATCAPTMKRLPLADARRAPLGAAVHRHVLAEDVALARLEPRRAARRGAWPAARRRRRRTGARRCAAEARRAAHDGVRVEDAALARAITPASTMA